jgi:hypothetical protein
MKPLSPPFPVPFALGQYLGRNRNMNSETIPTTFVESSALHDVTYDAENRILELTFTSGSVYAYHDVPAHIARELLQAESKGRYFHAHVRDHFPFTRVAR